jgi:periplasmic protein TonB
MEPARRQWLAAFTLALLLHVTAGMALIASWQAQPRVPVAAGAAGVEVALFPGFEQALREASIETPDQTGTEAAPLEPALAPPESVPLDPILPQSADTVPTALAPEWTESAPAPLEATAVVADVVPVESVEPSAATETPAVVKALPVAPGIEAAEPVDLARAPDTATPAPADLPAETLQTAEAPVAVPVAPTEVIPVPEAADTVAVVDTVAAFETSEPAIDPVREAPIPPVSPMPPVPSVSEPALPSAPEPVPELPALVPLTVAGAPLVEAPSATAETAPVEPETPASLPDTVEMMATPAADPLALEVPETLAMAPLEIVQAQEPEPAPRPAEETLRDPAESAEERVAESPSGTRPTAPPEASEDGIVAAAPPPSPAAEEARRSAQPPRPGIEAAYLAALQARLERYKDYPRPARRRGEEGTVLLRFTINRYGMVIEHAIVQSSGFQSLDNSVEHMIRRAQPLPAIPHEMGRDWMQVILPVQFQLER